MQIPGTFVIEAIVCGATVLSNHWYLPMLTEASLNYLRPLKYDANAERRCCLIPLGGIYWSDEIPDFRDLMCVTTADRQQIYRLFSIRFKLWADEILSDDDQTFWNEARKLVPDYPVFHRVVLSEDDRKAQQVAEEETLAAFEALFDGADEVKVNNDGSFSATFDLTKGETLS